MRTSNKLLGTFTVVWIITVGGAVFGSEGTVFPSESAGFSSNAGSDGAHSSVVRPHRDR